MPAFSPADLSIVIPTRDRWPILAKTLGALRAQTVSGFETIVVADGKDQTPPAAPGARVLVRDRAGPGAARNTGVDASDRPLVLFLGDDMIPVPELVAGHLRRHRDHPDPETAVLGHVEWHKEVPHNGIVRWLQWSGTQFDFPPTGGSDPGWGRFYSCNVSLKRSLFLEVGGFDEDFKFDYEDLDLAFRLNRHGLKLFYDPALVAYHLHRYDFDRLAQRYESRARAERLMQRKHPWFSPYFAGLVREAAAHPRVSPLWPVVADRLPERLGRLRALSRERTSTWFHQQLAPRFLAAWDGEDDLAELKAYLGDGFDIRLLWGHHQAVDDELDRASDEATFYRTSEMYLYDLTAFAMWDTKRPYVAALTAAVPPGSSVLDYGCGTGSDGLRLLGAGYRVSFADYDNPSTRFLRWRLERRGLHADIHDVDGEVPGGFDAAFAFDVIEHAEDPLAFLDQLEQRADVVAVNLLEPDPADTHLHHPLPVRAILRRATERGLLHYRRYHGRSHLVIYRSRGRGGWRSWRERMTGEATARLDGVGPAVRRAALR